MVSSRSRTRRSRGRAATLAALAAAIAIAAALFATYQFLGDRDAPRVELARSPSRDGARPNDGDGDGAVSPRAESELPPPLDPAAATAGPARVEEGARRELLVRVVDAARDPVAGIPVALGVVGSDDDPGPSALGRSGSDGIAVLRGFDDALRREPAGASWCVYFPFPETEASLVPIDPSVAHPQPIEIVAPARGRLLVKVVDGAGRPVDARGELLVFTGPPAEDLKRLASLGYGAAEIRGVRPLALPLTSVGELVIDPIAIGVKLRIESRLAEFAPAATDGEGPTTAGQTATLRLVLPQFGPVVAGRLVGAGDGVPVALRQLEGLIHDDPAIRARQGDVRFESDASGRFRFDASRYEAAPETRPLWLDLLEIVDRKTRGRARVALPVPLRSGVVEVGDVAFESAPLVVAGRVIDDAGAPIEGAGVEVHPADGPRPMRSSGRTSMLLKGESGADGTFAIHGFVDATELVAVAMECDFEPIDVRSVRPSEAAKLLERRALQRELVGESSPVPFARGQRDVTLVVRDCGSVEGSVLVDRGLGSLYVGLFLRRADAADATNASRGRFGQRVPIETGRFRWQRVPAGLVDVGIGFAADEIFHVVPGVEVKAGEVNADPRLAGLDLRRLLPRFRVEVVDLDGAPLRHGTVHVVPGDEFFAGGSEQPSLVIVNDGVAELPTTQVRLDFVVRAIGYRTARRRGALSPARVVLEPGIPATIAIDPPLAPEECHPSMSLGVTLVPLGRDAKEPALPRMRLDASGAAAVFLPDCGRFAAELDVGASFRPSGDSMEAGMDRLRRWNEALARFRECVGRSTIEIAESDREPSIRLSLPPAARAALADLARIAGEP